MVPRQNVVRGALLAGLLVTCLLAQSGAAQQEGRVSWTHLSSTQGQIPQPDVGRQVATLILDIDKDGVNDFVVASYEKMAWFRRSAQGWTRYAVENGAPSVRMEAGGDVLDLDGDGDLDILMGAQSKAGEIWWWENPYPNFQPDQPWKRHQVIAVGGTHHDQIFGDFDGDGKTELAFWYNVGDQLFLAEIPPDPTKPWPVTLIAQVPAGKQHPEGFAKIDINGDGKLDIVGGGYWFEHVEGTTFKVHPVDEEYRFSRSAAGDLIVASVQNGEVILSKYTGGDATAAPAWQVDLGALQNGGSIGGLAVSGNQIYLSGSTQNAALDAGGSATIVGANSGGSDAFVFGATDNGASATSNFVSYVGTGGIDKGGGLTVGSDGTVYLAGTTTGTFAGQVRNVASTNNMFVTAMASNGSIGWTRQYGGADGQSSGQGIAIDATGSSVLDALGLPRGKVSVNQSTDLTSLTTLRAGDSFKIEIEGTAGRTFTIAIDKGETLKSLVTKINIELASNGKASIAYGAAGRGLKIEVNAGVTAKLLAGPADFDALARLGIAPGRLTDGSTSGSSSSSTSSTRTFGLGLATNLDISTASAAGAARAQLLNVLSAIQKAYQTTNTPVLATSATSQSGGTVPAYLQSQLSSYSLALNLLSGGASSTTITG